MRRNPVILLISLFLACYPAAPAFAWGELGHWLIAVAAAKLVKNPDLKKFLTDHQLPLGYLANVPDTYWRDLAEGKAGEGAHFLNPQKTGIDIATLPLKWKDFVKRVGLTESQAAIDIGSLWWRADQFQRLALEAAKKAKREKIGSDSYKDAVFRMLIHMGLLAHFPGDASQPLHNNADYDGWDTGHGGFHNYYEGELVNALGVEALDKVVAKAQELIAGRDPMAGRKSLLEKMRMLSVFSTRQLPELLKLDEVLEPSDRDSKKKAVRPPAEEAAGKFEKYIIEQLARSAMVVAQAWDDIYEKAGKPNLKDYRSYRWPHAPLHVDYIRPDYFMAPITEPPPTPPVARAKCDPKALAPSGSPTRRHRPR